jgi:putative transposase
VYYLPRPVPEADLAIMRRLDRLHLESMDITYIPMTRGFVYLAVVLDWFSRRVLSWRASITMEAAFCVEALEDAMARHGKPEIFNTDQGSQFTGQAFTGVRGLRA